VGFSSATTDGADIMSSLVYTGTGTAKHGNYVRGGIWN
jgi:hypothetical protein